jgi:hypothetical protein
VPKTVAKPALIPQITSFRRSRGRSRRIEATLEASAAPICAHGPSFPTEPPTAMVNTVATSLTGATVVRIRPHRRWTASITFSVPCPVASGASHHTIAAAPAKPKGRSESRTGTLAAWALAQASAFRKALVDSLVTAPTAAASAVHFRRLANSVVSSRN